jgi:hypothetical protein
MNKLTDDKYERPAITYTDKLSESDIKAKLEGYRRVNTPEELAKIPLGTHLRYFSYIEDDDEYKFRMGGVLLNVDGIPKYVVLGNGSKSWCAQVSTSVFFKKLNNKELKDEYEEVIHAQNKQIDKIKKDMKKKTIKYKLSDIDQKAVLTSINDLHEGDFVKVANKRMKKVYDTMYLYKIRFTKSKSKESRQIKKVIMINERYEEYSFNRHDYYFYVVPVKKASKLYKSVQKYQALSALKK